jgi:hypothetical protein
MSLDGYAARADGSNDWIFGSATPTRKGSIWREHCM